MKIETKRLTALAITLSFAIILSYLESIIPVLVAIPGVKIGLANIAVIFALYKFGAREAAVISLLRIFLISILFANPISMIYSLSGGALSLIAMILLKRLTPLGKITISICGGVLHNVGQIAAASFMLSTDLVVYYLPFLLLSGIIAGCAVGVAAGIMIKRINI